MKSLQLNDQGMRIFMKYKVLMTNTIKSILISNTIENCIKEIINYYLK